MRVSAAAPVLTRLPVPEPLVSVPEKVVLALLPPVIRVPPLRLTTPLLASEPMVSPAAVRLNVEGLLTLRLLPSAMPLPLPSLKVPLTRLMVPLVGGLRPAGSVGVPAVQQRMRAQQIIGERRHQRA